MQVHQMDQEGKWLKETGIMVGGKSMYKHKRCERAWGNAEDGSRGSQIGEMGVSPMTENLETWLWISGFVLQETVLLKGSQQGIIMFDFSEGTSKVTSPYTLLQGNHGPNAILISQMEKLRFKG